MKPHGLPATTLVVGWPDETPQRYRLPREAWIHDERYHRPSRSNIEEHFREHELRGRARYMDSSPEMAQVWRDHGITSLAQYYTSRIKYDPDRFAGFSDEIEAPLRERGYWAGSAQ